MATVLANNVATLADFKAQMAGDGKIEMAIDLLSQTNEVTDDMLWMEANEGMSHKTTVRTGLPAAYWRTYNTGVPRGKSTTAQITDTCAMLETYSLVDRDLAQLNGNSAAWRMGEDMAFVEGMSQEMATTLFYGNQVTTPNSFNGLSLRYSTVNAANAANAVNVIDAGGTGSTNTSMWLVTWGQNTCHGIYQKGSVAGIQVEDVTTLAPVQDANGNPYRALQTHYKWDCGLTVRDWRYNVRIPNIDVTTLTGGSPPNLISLMTTAVAKLPTVPRSVGAVQAATRPSGIAPVPMRSVFYVNRTLRTALDLQVENKSNVLLRLEQWDGMPVLTFRGIPIRTVDALVNYEARVV